MTNITEIIDQAAKKYCACGMDKGCVHKTAFTVGVEWASTDPEMMKAMLKPFAEWIDKTYYNDGDYSFWRELGTLNYYSAEELISKYIQFITDKNETGKNKTV